MLKINHKEKLEIIYKILFNEYKNQGWWPITLDGKTKAEYHPADYSYPKTDKQKLEIIFGALLTQNTSWKNVEKAISELHNNHLIDIRRILAIDKNELAALIKSSGYHNQKAQKLKNVCLLLKKNTFQELEMLDLQELRIKLLSVNGIGPETADSILLYAFNRPIFVIDTYTKRIFSRLGFYNEDVSYDELQQLFMNNLTGDYQLFQEYHALLVEHAKECCTAKADPKNCWLRKKIT